MLFFVFFLCGKGAMAKKVLLLKNASVPSDPYHEVFTENRYKSHFIPLLTHRHFDRSQTVEYLQSSEFVENVAVFIITSQRAVEMFGDCLSSIPPDVKQRIITEKVGYTVGPATHSVLKKLGFTDVRGGERAGNGLKLAHLVKQDIQDLSTPIVFFTGEVRKDIIPRSLKEWNYNLVENIIYTTEVREDVISNFNNYVQQENNGTGDGWIVFFSPQGTEEIVEFVKVQPKSRYRIASIGPTTEEYLLENQITPDVVASKPQAASLFEAIAEYDRQH
ncbi:Uroporphyrinogen-III synthetase [Scheffersomyces xylosifermentans]|uniref:Uroporphyrinogen-III synthetase n=1 Tax=Scheffersomyces xylosifermentans TaxID=1304137 RepID=UPI00315DFB1E